MIVKKLLAAVIIISIMAMFSATALYAKECLTASIDNPKGPFSLLIYVGFGVTAITYAFHIAAREATYTYEDFSLVKQSICWGFVTLLIFIIFISIVYAATFYGILIFTLCFVINNSLIPFAEHWLLKILIGK